MAKKNKVNKANKANKNSQVDATAKAEKDAQLANEQAMHEQEAKEEGKKGKGKKKAKAGKKEKKVLVLAHDKPKLSQAAITKRIVAKVEAETKTAIEIGVLLEEAKFYFYEGKRMVGTKHIEWAKENFGFAKSQTHKYVKIGKVFGELEGFDGVPMGVLATMASDDKILNSALEAMKTAKDEDDAEFKIDNVWLRGYNERLEAQRLELQEAEDLTIEEEVANMDLDAIRELFEKLEGKEAGKKQEKGLRSAIAKHEDDAIEQALFDITKAKQEEANANATVKKERFDKVQAELDAQQAIVDDLKAQLEVSQTNEGSQGGEGELLNARDKALHKHMSKLPAYMVLGVAEGASKRDVNKAKRALENIYSPKFDHGCASIWELVEGAVTELTK